MDIRTILVGAIGLTNTISATVLFAMDKLDGAKVLAGAAGVALAYLIGLHSDPKRKP